GHEGAVGDAGRAFVPVAYDRFQIDRAGVAVAKDFGERQELRLVEHPQPPREHAVAAERDREIASFGGVGHWGCRRAFREPSCLRLSRAFTFFLDCGRKTWMAGDKP